MKYDCALIRDILPLFHDNALSSKSKEIIGDHLSQCPDCRKTYEEYLSDEESPLEQSCAIKNAAVREYSKKIKRLRVTIASVVLFIILTVTGSLLSMIEFNTPNFIAAGIGVVRVIFTDTEFVQVQGNPKIMIAKPSYQAFLNTVESEGYTVLGEEQMGSMHIIEKNGKKENVFFSMNRYYSKWVWD